jgi:hypothetical protein
LDNDKEVMMAKKNSARRRPRKLAAKKPTRTRAAANAAKRKTAARSAAARKGRERKPPPKASKLSTSATFVRGAVAGAIATVSSKMPGPAAQPDAIEILEREHRRFEELLKRGEESTGQARRTRRELLATLTAELNAHELMEEKVFYPALQAHAETREIVLEGFQEHHIADVIVKELQAVAPNDEVWGAKFKVLKENIAHHIQEEEGNMFRFARGIFSREELRDLGARMLKSRRPNPA